MITVKIIGDVARQFNTPMGIPLLRQMLLHQAVNQRHVHSPSVNGVNVAEDYQVKDGDFICFSPPIFGFGPNGCSCGKTTNQLIQDIQHDHGV